MKNFYLLILLLYLGSIFTFINLINANDTPLDKVEADLEVAMKSNDLIKIAQLLTMPLHDIDQKNQLRIIALNLAVIELNLEAVELVLEKNPDLTLEPNFSEQEILPEIDFIKELLIEWQEEKMTLITSIDLKILQRINKFRKIMILLSRYIDKKEIIKHQEDLYKNKLLIRSTKPNFSDINIITISD